MGSAGELDIRLEGLTYILRFSRPLFEFWGRGNELVRNIYEPLVPHGATLSNLVLTSSHTNGADIILTIRLSEDSNIKFAFDRMEFSFTRFSQEFFESIPNILESTTSWLKRDTTNFKFTSHSFAYNSHAFVKDEPVDSVLMRIGPKSPKSIGSGLGNGAIYHSVVHEKRWQTRVIIDRSVPVVGALYTGLLIDAEMDALDYAEFMFEGRSYYEAILAEFGLRLPESEGIR